MRQWLQRRPGEEAVQDILPNGCAEAIRNLRRIQETFQKGTEMSAYFQRIEDDIQLNCILTSNRVINLACIGERSEYYDRDDQQEGS